jgi:(p)ppGpp synthase/HD superfamily hydrolase
MGLGSDQPSEVEGFSVGAESRLTSRAGRVASPQQQSSLVRSALVFAVRCHARQRRRSDGTAFIEHPLKVAGLLHDAGCSDVVVAAGLLHDVVEDSQVTA